MEALSQGRATRVRRPWTDEDQRRAEELRAQGLSYQKIADALSRSRSAVRCWLDPAAREKQREAVRRFHATHRHPPVDGRRPWTREDQRQMEALQAQGLSYYAIGREMGRDRGLIRYRLDIAARDHACRHAQGMYWRDVEQSRIRARRRYAGKPGYYAEASKRYREANRDKVLGRLRAYYVANRDEMMARHRRWRNDNSDHARHYARQWRASNPDKARESNRRAGSLRRAARRRALVPVTLDKIDARLAKFGHACAYCESTGRLTVDHVLALIAGGLDEAANIVPACGRCNSSKQAKPVEQWYRRQPFFSETRWRKIQRHCPGVAAGQLPLALLAV